MAKVKALPPDMAAAVAEGERLRKERRERVDAYSAEQTQVYLREHGTLAPEGHIIPRATRHIHGDCLRPVEKTDVFINVVVEKKGTGKYAYEAKRDVVTEAEQRDGVWMVRGARQGWTPTFCRVMRIGVER